ncbi:hypothetical protein G3N95_23400 [Paraburkholderia sp. Tr-20389]|uniref:hypothetical protein n=1 Tax=Paraburkholderia sp. Tr-20389 TaxID=2703903 RepID=UPI00198187B4|nr:hypothetical protein [Paraburkholderia sp. Tr-20389]MBN3755911.1 hypothetical protein [Paraburkholderia sp. Tr-20389]
MEIVGGVLIFLAVVTVPVGLMGLVSPKTVSPKGKPPLPRVKILWSFTLAFLVFGIAGGALVGRSQPSKSARNDSSPSLTAEPSSQATTVDVNPHAEPPAPQLPTHNYVMRDGDLYGYQPAISDAERNQGVATKALVMVRYRGQKNDVYTVEMPNDTGAIYRLECKSPCEYVKTKIILGGEVLKSETVPNAPGSLMAAVFDDVLSDQLQPAVVRSRVAGNRSKGG